MLVVVTGASGFIGRHLLPRLSERHEVVAVVPRSGGSYSGKVPTVTVVDLAGTLDAGALPERIDVIIHLAQANVGFPERASQLFAVNTMSTQNLLDYGRRAGAHRFILASSGDVYGGRIGLSKESDQVAPRDFYAVTKHASELLALAYSSYLEPCVLRLFHPFGPGQSNRLIPKLAERIREGRPIRLNRGDRPHVTPVYIDDVVMAFERAITSHFRGVINVAGDRAISLRELAEEIARALDLKPLFEESGEEAGDLMGDNALMKQVMGTWPMVGLAEGLSRAL